MLRWLGMFEKQFWSKNEDALDAGGSQDAGRAPLKKLDRSVTFLWEAVTTRSSRHS